MDIDDASPAKMHKRSPPYSTLPQTASELSDWLCSIGASSANELLIAHGLSGPIIAGLNDDRLAMLGVPECLASVIMAGLKSPIEPPQRRLKTTKLSQQQVVELLQEKTFDRIGDGRATSVRLVRGVALKVWPSTERDSRQAKSCFARTLFDEARAMLDCAHQFVVELLGYSADPGSLCLAVENCECGTLAQEVEANKKKARGHARRYAHDLADALQHVHKCGYVHCDIKPHNCFLKRDENHIRLKLGDFGHAFPFKEMRKEVRGTTGWVAPEIAETTVPVAHTTASDVYSYGLVLWYMVEATGGTPTGKPNPRPWWNEQWVELYRDCTVKKPEQRITADGVALLAHALPSIRNLDA